MDGFKRDASGWYIEKDANASLPYTLQWHDWLRGSDQFWSKSTWFRAGDTVTPSKANHNGKRYRANDSGVSSTTEPTWPASSTVVDGGITWEYLGAEDAIASVAWTVATGLTNVSTSNTDWTATIVLSGGTVDTTYTVACRVTTDAGYIDDRSFRVVVVSR